MGTVTSQCLHCKQLVAVDTDIARTPEFRCTYCATRQRQYIYPAFAHDNGPTPSTPLPEDGASCYFHEGAAAATLCDDCGRYLCELCTLDIPMPASAPPNFPARICPSCFENRVNEETREQQWDLFRSRYPRYDAIAAFLILIPVVFVPLILFTIVTIPMAIYIVIRNWRTCHTPVKHLRGSMLAVLALALFGLTIWLSIIGLTAAEYL